MNFGFWNFYTFYNKNRMFTETRSLVGDELAYPTFHLGKKLRELGHEVSTLDMQELSWFDKIFFIDYPTKLNPRFRQLLKTKHPHVNLIIAEPPIVRPDNYTPKTHSYFKRVMTWKKDLCPPNQTKFVPYCLPNKMRAIAESRPFSERKLCVIINSFMFSVHPRELYSERIRAIRWFEANAPKDFDLIGVDWDRPLFTGQLSKLNFPLRFAYRRVPALKSLRVHRFPSFIGPNKKSKILTLQDYRFCLAYENSVEPDYFSEKMFDSFFAGCVPIYAGAPNIRDVIPANTFIDKNNFKTYDELYRYISGMSETEYNQYLAAIKNFVNGPDMYPFTAEAFADTFIANFV
jgi:alpha(1,3/1,4) fucosyltransferase